MVGQQASAFPAMARRVYSEGHSIGTHTQDHPRQLQRMPFEKVKAEIDGGIASVTAALGDPKALSPFFRIPGLNRTPAIDNYLASRHIVNWSVDAVADDWTHISAAEVMRRALLRLDSKGKGILLLHDIQPATALALPWLLKELKNRGYRIVHVVPATPDQPKTVTEPQQWVMSPRKRGPSRVAAMFPAPDARSFGLPKPLSAIPANLLFELGGRQAHPTLTPVSLWPTEQPSMLVTDHTALASPALQSFGVTEPFNAESVIMDNSQPAADLFPPKPAVGSIVQEPAIKRRSHRAARGQHAENEVPADHWGLLMSRLSFTTPH
jgi:hypothetical protein